MAEDKKDSSELGKLVDVFGAVAAGAAIASREDLRNGVGQLARDGVSGVVEFRARLGRWWMRNAAVVVHGIADLALLCIALLSLVDLVGQYVALLATQGLALPWHGWAMPIGALVLNLLLVGGPLNLVVRHTQSTRNIPWTFPLMPFEAFPPREGTETEEAYAERLRRRVRVLRAQMARLLLDTSARPAWVSRGVAWAEMEMRRIDPTVVPARPVAAQLPAHLRALLNALHTLWGADLPTAHGMNEILAMEELGHTLERDLEIAQAAATVLRFGPTREPIVPFAVILLALVMKGLLTIESRSFMYHLYDVQGISSLFVWMSGLGCLFLFDKVLKIAFLGMNVLGHAIDTAGAAGGQLVRAALVVAPGVTTENVDDKFPKSNWALGMMTGRWLHLAEEIFFAGLASALLVLHIVHFTWANVFLGIGIGTSIALYLMNHKQIDTLEREQKRILLLYGFMLVTGAWSVVSLLNVAFGWYLMYGTHGPALQGGGLLLAIVMDLLRVLFGVGVVGGVTGGILLGWLFTLGWFGFIVAILVCVIALRQLTAWEPEGKALWFRNGAIATVIVVALVAIGGRIQQTDGRSASDRGQILSHTVAGAPTPPQPADDGRGIVRHMSDTVFGTRPWFGGGSNAGNASGNARTTSNAAGNTNTTARATVANSTVPRCDDLDLAPQFRADLIRHGDCRE